MFERFRKKSLDFFFDWLTYFTVCGETVCFVTYKRFSTLMHRLTPINKIKGPKLINSTVM